MKHNMKVRLDISPLATKKMSGIGNYTLLLAQALAEDKDIDLELVYFNFLNRQHNPKFNRTKIKINKLVPLRVYAKLSSYNIAPPLDVLKSKTDLTIFTNFTTWPTIKSKYVATAVHDLTYIYFPEVVEAKNLEHLKRSVPFTVKKADIIITISNAVKNEIIKEFGIDASKIIVTHIPPSDEFKKVCTKKEKNDVLRKYGIENKYIYFIGTFEPRKNLSSLIDAYLLLPKKLRQEYGLVLAGGKGWNSEKTEKKLTEAIKQGEKIQHIGYVDQDDSPALYQSASIFVLPSIYEGFGIPILEAMLSKCPVAASDIPVLRETSGDAALFFDPNNLRSIAEVIVKILTNDKLQKSLVAKGSKNVTRFSWENNIASIKETLRNLED